MLNSSLLCSFATNQKASPENKKVFFPREPLAKKLCLWVFHELYLGVNSLHVMQLCIDACGIAINCDNVPFLEWYRKMFLAILDKGELGLAHYVANF